VSRRPQAVVFYDAKCPLCRASIHAVLRADTRRRLRSAPLDSPEADRMLGRLSKEDRFGSFHLVQGDRLWSGGAAVGPLLDLLPPVAWAGGLLRRSPAGRRAATAVYRFVARHRGRVASVFRGVGPPPR
jgi:predicted DCC family thiol-disulfide oxidoreductase YuxK